MTEGFIQNVQFDLFEDFTQNIQFDLFSVEIVVGVGDLFSVELIIGETATLLLAENYVTIREVFVDGAKVEPNADKQIFLTSGGGGGGDSLWEVGDGDILQPKADKTFTIKKAYEVNAETGSTDKFLNEQGDFIKPLIKHKDVTDKNAETDFLHATQEQHDRWTNNYSYKIEDTSVTTWAASTAYAGYAFQAQINIADLSESDFVNVVFGVNDAISGNYAPAIEQYEGYILVFAKVNTTITIPTIEITKIEL